jgi:hypothetical protein
VLAARVLSPPLEKRGKGLYSHDVARTELPGLPRSPSAMTLSFLFAQDIAHARSVSAGVNVPTVLSLAGFQVIVIGRFWVIAED